MYVGMLFLYLDAFQRRTQCLTSAVSEIEAHYTDIRRFIVIFCLLQ